MMNQALLDAKNEEIACLRQQPTLRDQFAMNVITGLMAGVTNDTEWNEHEYSKTCYEVADAMIAAREGK